MPDIFAPKALISAALQQLYQDHNKALLSRIQSLLADDAPVIAHAFYQEMLAIKDASIFLNPTMVETRLIHSMVEWLRDLLSPHHADAIDAFLERQIQVGHIHARINIPLWLVVHGMRLVKREFSSRLIASRLPDEDIQNGLILLNDLIDLTMSLINESYVNDRLVSGQHINAMRLHSTKRNLALECERHKSALLEWMRAVLLQVRRGDYNLAQIPSAQKSDLGSWLSHKGAFLFPERPEIEDLLDRLRELDRVVHSMEHMPVVDEETINHLVEQINDSISRCTWLLGNLAKESLEIDSSKDPLTQLFNRRYLPVVLQHETSLSLRTRSPFSVLLVDIDHFKAINDNYGHSAGDDTLMFVAETLTTTLRAGDHIFRYGGEEFLVILVDADARIASVVANKIVERIARHSVNPEAGLAFSHPLTVSVGLAVFNGHPDYQQTVMQADSALYQAKAQGRNCWRLFHPAQTTENHV